jgi:hypothetical protein
MAKKGFWDKFEDMMDSLPDYIDKQVNSTTIGSGNVIQTSSRGKSTQIVNGTKIVTESVNGKQKITINGEEVVPKKYADDLYSALETTAKSIPVQDMPAKAVQAISRSTSAYSKYKEKLK